ncbi:hypothetical protein GCM10007276_28040 [Agaricicola taiwanensis]|uniref:DUF2384 domain-containing protein n=1 Tax=Agaricicola taiwanensis TaxID=591372 RepID=A0A8J3DZX0_9RHOB|nr:MbcA/ParS/Xre antitoxin family protein [Agaricicola taiwanensis]GGE49302.1 hypothetical protein GCM10007276_28040 [Agaricicola taiwanensis]
MPNNSAAIQLTLVQPTPANSAVDRITDEEAAALARTTVNLFRAWGLSDAEACTLLGGMALRTWARWKEGAIGRIDRDLRARMAILMGIHKGLRHLFRDPARGYAWIRKPNAFFAGQSALDVMMRGEMTDLIDVRGFLDAERGAW